jgi:hypothetical protein
MGIMEMSAAVEEGAQLELLYLVDEADPIHQYLPPPLMTETEGRGRKTCHLSYYAANQVEAAFRQHLALMAELDA